DQMCLRMIHAGTITQEEGLAFPTNPSNLLLRLSGLGSSDDFIREGGNPMQGVPPSSAVRPPTPSAPAAPPRPAPNRQDKSSSSSMLDMIEKN
ncbi:MAG TPA: twitching motility protein, partial [Blastocatellia bacterium]|nr:twitching motility protein [Blastocatellia bacterium]